MTDVDLACQHRIIELLEEGFPDDHIIAEEKPNSFDGSKNRWIVDPLDGTTNFIHRIPFFCVSIALLKDREPALGVCCNPMGNETFWAQTGKGAYRNGAHLKVSRTERMIDSLVATGFPYDVDDIDTLMRRFSRILRKARGIRRLGSAALDLCYVASGSFDAFWEQGLKPWDMAAGVVILREAGGMVSGIDGTPFDLYRGDILASNSRVHDELQRCMNDEHN